LSCIGVTTYAGVIRYYKEAIINNSKIRWYHVDYYVFVLGFSRMETFLFVKKRGGLLIYGR